MNFFKKLFSKSNRQKLNFISCGLERFENESGYDCLLKEESHGYLIKGVFDQKEIQKLIKGLDKIPEEKFFEAKKGTIIYPRPMQSIDFNALKPEYSAKQYFNEADELWKDFPDLFGLDLKAHLNSKLQKFFGNRKINSALGPDDLGIYNLACFRKLNEGLGQFEIHCGNFFHEEFQLPYSHLQTVTKVEDQLSYFLVLKKCEEGGELIVYDAFWNEYKNRRDGDLLNESGEIVETDNEKKLPRISLDPEPGDMIIFSGGKIWHKVENVKKGERITLGGFITPGINKEVYFWA